MFDPTWIAADFTPLNDTEMLDAGPSETNPVPVMAMFAPGHIVPSAGVCVSPDVGEKLAIVTANADPVRSRASIARTATLAEPR